jgi:outer membrane protein assembly factor BamE (lipoprotein component of BamABCDE complex)
MRIRRAVFRSLFAATAVVASLAACHRIEREPIAGRDIAVDRVQQIVPRETTREQVVEWFGAPDLAERKPDGSEELRYTYRGYVKETNDLVAWAKKTTTEERKNLTVVVRDGVVERVSYANSAAPEENLSR